MSRNINHLGDKGLGETWSETDKEIHGFGIAPNQDLLFVFFHGFDDLFRSELWRNHLIGLGGFTLHHLGHIDTSGSHDIGGDSSGHH